MKSITMLVSNLVGCTELEYVHKANVMVARMVWLVLYGVRRGIHWILEQPLSSLMGGHPKMQLLQLLADMGAIDMYYATGWMGAHGAMTPKGAKWWGSKDLACLGDGLSRSEMQAMRIHSVKNSKKQMHADGSTSVTGGPGLKESQEYPHEYGQDIVDLFRRDVTAPLCDASKLAANALQTLSWDDCEFGGLEMMLTDNGF